MKAKKILFIILSCFILVGCTNLKDVSYDEIMNNLTIAPKRANVHRQGYQFFIPQGMQVEKAGLSYAILSSNNVDYYLYIDLISYNAKDTSFVYEINKNALYSTTLNYQDKKGYVEIKLQENNQYLIEIMYNYAKIEVMVDENKVKEALSNSATILNSIRYDDLIIKNLLTDDNLDYTEEKFNMFDDIKENNNVLDYGESTNQTEDNEKVKDTDYVD